MTNRHMLMLVLAYWTSIIAGNLLVHHLGAPGIIITSFVFIPFDFIIRCVVHERLKRWQLYLALFGLIGSGAFISYVINEESINIAKASVIAFFLAGTAGSLIYQLLIRKRALIKINASDAGALIVDSIAFQLVAFSIVEPGITIAQVFVKIIGGFLWYYVLFVKFDMMKKIKAYRVDKEGTLAKVVVVSEEKS